MDTTTRRPWLASLVLAALLAACAPQPSTPPTGDLCLARAEFQVALTAFRELDSSTTTIDEYRSAWIIVQRTFGDMREKALELADDRFVEVNQAIDDLTAALDDLPDGTSAAEAVAAVEDELAAVSAAVDALDAELDCPI